MRGAMTRLSYDGFGSLAGLRPHGAGNRHQRRIGKRQSRPWSSAALISATLLTLLMLPALYAWSHRRSRWLTGMKEEPIASRSRPGIK